MITSDLIFILKLGLVVIFLPFFILAWILGVVDVFGFLFGPVE